MMDTKKTSPANTVLTIVTGFVIIFMMTKKEWAIYVALVVGIAGLLSPALASLIDKVWMKIGVVLSYIVPNILLSLVFFLFLTPIALISRLFKKKDALTLVNPKGSVYNERNKLFEANDLENPW